jgi:periplasmic protein TonB
MGYQALLFCPDEKTARTVTQVLNELDFTVEPCTEPFAAVKKLMAQHFDGVVVDCDNEQNATLLFKSARNSSANQSSLAVAVVEGQAGVAKAFRIGANLVLTKPINVEQAKGTLRVARGLLRKGADAAAKMAPTAAATPVSPAATPTTPAAVRPPAAKVPARPSFAAHVLKPSVPAPRLKPQGAPPVPTLAASANSLGVEGVDSDTILEADDAEVLEAPSTPPAKPGIPAPATPPSNPRKFPWQPTPKPMAEPVASSLRRAAETASKADSGDSAPVKSAHFAATEERRPAASAIFPGHGVASATAPAKEQPPVSAAASAPATSVISEPAFPEVSQPKVEETPSASNYSHRDLTPPTFFPGAYNPDEVEGGSKKPLIIVAAVVLLACSAGYMSWKNTNGKSAALGASTQSTSTPAATAPATDGGKQQESAPAPQPAVSEITLAEDAGTSAPAPKAPAAARALPKAAVVAAASVPEPEVTQRIVVKNDTRRLAPATPQQEQDQIQAPSTIGMDAPVDSKALASIGSALVNVPKPSPQVVKVSQGVMEGLVLKRVQPRYPAQAMQMRIQGAVQLQATISRTGGITNLRVLSGDGILARSAQEAVKQWKYKPYFLNGEPVEIQTEILVNFRLPN